ncbi:MAG TPA: hypothetical protein VHX66_14545 [Solirubrobacteraceae bacterium]|nr:hypothetical protein [Solirubrobacteraceae bacterium]
MSSPSSTKATWSEVAADALIGEGIDLVCYLPDSVVSQLHRALESRVHTVRLNREEEGVGICAGYWLSGRRCCFLMQNTGFGNAVNATLGLLVGMRIPCLFVISIRGLLGEFNPGQVPVGVATRHLLDAVGVPHFAPESLDMVAPIVRGACRLTEAAQGPVALLLETQLTGGKGGL